jgi:hypothetical protein
MIALSNSALESTRATCDSAVLNAVPEKDHDGNCDNDGNDDTDEKIALVALVFHISQNDQTRATLPRPRQRIAFMSFRAERFAG